MPSSSPRPGFHILESAQCIRLPVGPVERHHQVLPESLMMWMSRNELLELGDQLPVASQLQVTGQPRFESFEPPGIERSGLNLAKL